MAKNKGTFGKGKNTEIPETDEFLSTMDRVTGALRPHAAKILVLVGVIAVVSVGLTTWQWWKAKKAEEATALLAHAVALSQVQVTDVPPEPNPRLPPDPRDVPTYYKSRADRATAVLAVIGELESDYGSSGAAKSANLLAGDALLELDRPAEALERYKAFLQGGNAPEPLELSAKEGVAYALEAIAMAEKDSEASHAGLGKALAAFEAMQTNEDGFGRDESLFHQARILHELGKRDEAIARYEKVLADHPDSPLKPDVEMRLLEIQTESDK